MIERQDYNEAAIARRLVNLLIAILVASVVVALGIGYWSILRSEALSIRPDNPRVVETELRLQRGSIVDRNNVVLAENVGPLDHQSRLYPLPEAGPAVGHYSLRYGATGIEAAYDALLRGDDISPVANELNKLMHVPAVGRDIRLSLDATLQQTSARLMAGQQGALVLLQLTGTEEQPAAEVRAMVSQPWYDPNSLDALVESASKDGEASFLNRATQGQYQPGLVLFPLLAATAIDNDTIDPAGDWVARLPADINRISESCRPESPDETLGWLAAVRGLCADAAADLGELMGQEALRRSFRAWGLTTTPAIPILSAEASEPPIPNTANAGLGLESINLSPLQVALAYAALAGNGTMPLPRMVDAEEATNGNWVNANFPATTGSIGRAVSQAAATAIRKALPQTDGIAGISVPVTSSSAGELNQWFIGLTPNEKPGYVVVVVLENPEDPGTAETIGRSVLAQALLQP